MPKEMNNIMQEFLPKNDKIKKPGEDKKKSKCTKRAITRKKVISIAKLSTK